MDADIAYGLLFRLLLVISYWKIDNTWPSYEGKAVSQFFYVNDNVAGIDDLALKELGLCVFPNPNNGAFEISGLNLFENASYIYKILDLSGL